MPARQRPNANVVTIADLQQQIAALTTAVEALIQQQQQTIPENDHHQPLQPLDRAPQPHDRAPQPHDRAPLPPQRAREFTGSIDPAYELAPNWDVYDDEPDEEIIDVFCFDGEVNDEELDKDPYEGEPVFDEFVGEGDEMIFEEGKEARSFVDDARVSFPQEKLNIGKAEVHILCEDVDAIGLIPAINPTGNFIFNISEEIDFLGTKLDEKDFVASTAVKQINFLTVKGFTDMPLSVKFFIMASISSEEQGQGLQATVEFELHGTRLVFDRGRSFMKMRLVQIRGRILFQLGRMMQMRLRLSSRKL